MRYDKYDQYDKDDDENSESSDLDRLDFWRVLLIISITLCVILIVTIFLGADFSIYLLAIFTICAIVFFLYMYIGTKHELKEKERKKQEQDELENIRKAKEEQLKNQEKQQAKDATYEFRSTPKSNEKLLDINVPTQKTRRTVKSTVFDKTQWKEEFDRKQVRNQRIEKQIKLQQSDLYNVEYRKMKHEEARQRVLLRRQLAEKNCQQQAEPLDTSKYSKLEIPQNDKEQE